MSQAQRATTGSPFNWNLDAIVSSLVIVAFSVLIMSGVAVGFKERFVADQATMLKSIVVADKADRPRVIEFYRYWDSVLHQRFNYMLVAQAFLLNVFANSWKKVPLARLTTLLGGMITLGLWVSLVRMSIVLIFLQNLVAGGGIDPIGLDDRVAAAVDGVTLSAIFTQSYLFLVWVIPVSLLYAWCSLGVLTIRWKIGQEV
jgi:hypothetical protein